MQTPLSNIIAPSRPNQDFAAPESFAEFQDRYPNYLASYVRRRMLGAASEDQAKRVGELRRRLLTDGDRIARFDRDQTPQHFFGFVNFSLLNRA